MNNIRTILPKSTRQAAHSPPRHPPKPVVIETDNLSTNTTGPVPMIVTDDFSSSPIKEKTVPKAIKESASGKYSHRNSDGVLVACLSDPINSEELHSTSVPRKTYLHVLSQNQQIRI